MERAFETVEKGESVQRIKQHTSDSTASRLDSTAR